MVCAQSRCRTRRPGVVSEPQRRVKSGRMRTKRHRRSPYGLILVAVVLVALIAGTAYAVAHRSGSGDSAAGTCDASSVADTVLPSVVMIMT